ncbi:hypothetical protein PISMIDRAFT_15122 [Pisolithus microcarpus 441]|uniref:Uncharacterized protein n=1 Tax=Pisolithus microcarpus 441 TaxID=765257 RepID=A0A0C9YTV3_9AGAM|nr:hypothetical protein PISMIDRAFT_15122 [Pisolithus microcarpus 441]
MSNPQTSTSRQSTAAPSWDFSQVPDEGLEVQMDDSEETEHAKETKKGQCEAVKKERRAEIHRQRVAEQEQWVREECERQRAEEASQQAASAKGKGCVEELQRESRLVQMTRMGATPVYSPTTGARIGSMAVPIYWEACKECQLWGEPGECQVAVGGRSCGLCRKWKKKCSWVAKDWAASVSGSCKQVGTGGSQGERKKRGCSNVDDGGADTEAGVDEGSKASAPRFEAAGSCLVGERELRHRLPPDDEYHGRLLVAQEEQAIALEQQVAAMEQMAVAQEAQAVAMQVYMQVMQGQIWLPFPLMMMPRVGVPQGRALLGTVAVAEQDGSGVGEGTKSGGSERGGSADERDDEMDDE